MKNKLLELVQHTQTLKRAIHKNLSNDKGLNFIELSRLYRLMPQTPSQKMDETEFAKLFAMTIVMIYMQAVSVMRHKIKGPEMGWFLATHYISDLLYRIKQEDSYPAAKNTDIFRTLLIALQAVTIPLELKACILQLGLDHATEKSHEEGGDYHRMLPVYQEYIHLFEPDLQRHYGIFFTPPEAVSFMVRSIHTLLSSKLGKHGGLTHPHITILDPAAGPGTFFTSTLQWVVNQCHNHPEVVPISDFINPITMANYYSVEKILPLWALSLFHLHHLWLTLSIPPDKQCAQIFLGDVFDVYPQKPVTVILGNPPYSLQPGTTPLWLITEVQKYSKMATQEGMMPVEKNAKWLLADYVKFIRFAQLQITQNGEGVVGFIVNNGFLENPTFRGMRQSLMESFNEIYILDLHGNNKKPEKDAQGKRAHDQNLFDIKTGTAIVFFIKRKADHTPCQVYYSSLLGTQNHKKKYLQHHGLDTMSWQALSPAPGFYLFTPIMASQGVSCGHNPYSGYYKITDIFPVHSVSIVTGRDRLCIQDSHQKMVDTIRHFASLTEEEARAHYQLGEDSRDWSVAGAQKDIRASGFDANKVVPILYRPFDLRYTYYTGKSRGFLCMPRPDVMGHMLADNLALITVRQVAEGRFNHNFVTHTLSEGRLTTSNRGICYHFPLYFYEEGKQPGPCRPPIPNLNEAILETVTRQMGLTTLPEPAAIFYYIYGVLSSSSYRNKYRMELKMDFPRIPFPLEAEVFWEMSALGEELVRLHLLKAPLMKESVSQYQGAPNGWVKKVAYQNTTLQRERLYINEQDYFSHIPPPLWEYQMCGYPILHKTLTGLKGKLMDRERIAHFLRVVETVLQTMAYEKKMDLGYSHIEAVCVKPLVWPQPSYTPPFPLPVAPLPVNQWVQPSF